VTIRATDIRGQSADYWIRCLPHDFPALNISKHPENGAPTPGWYLTGNLATATAASYAMILDTNGTPVWYKHASGSASDVTPLGHNALAFDTSVPGATFGADANGGFDVYDLATNQVTGRIGTVGVPTDFHELQTLPNGNHLLLSYALKSGVDLTGLAGNLGAGPNSTIADCVLQEVNPSGALVWSWVGSDHIDPVTESTSPEAQTVNGQTVYDVFHCNSIDADTAGNLLLSARHTSAVFEIRRSDGKIVWKLSGTSNNKDGAQHLTIQNYPQVSLSRQHDARWLANGDISIFDNQSLGVGPAQGVEFALDLGAGTATPVFQFGAPSAQRSIATGAFRRLGDGDSVICWGITATFDGSLLTELNADGRDVLDINFGPGLYAYRALKAPPDQFDADVLRATAGT